MISLKMLCFHFGVIVWKKRLETEQVDRYGVNGGDGFVSVEDSARQVPMGPNPLHHNSDPTRP